MSASERLRVSALIFVTCALVGGLVTTIAVGSAMRSGTSSVLVVAEATQLSGDEAYVLLPSGDSQGHRLLEVDDDSVTTTQGPLVTQVDVNATAGTIVVTAAFDGAPSPVESCQVRASTDGSTRSAIGTVSHQDGNETVVCTGTIDAGGVVRDISGVVVTFSASSGDIYEARMVL